MPPEKAIPQKSSQSDRQTVAEFRLLLEEQEALASELRQLMSELRLYIERTLVTAVPLPLSDQRISSASCESCPEIAGRVPN